MTANPNTPHETRIMITPQSPEIRNARQVLARLSTQPGPHGPRAAVALAVLDTVHPPYPPVDELASYTAVPLIVAVEALRAAIVGATTLPEAIRLGQAALELPAPDEA